MEELAVQMNMDIMKEFLMANSQKSLSSIGISKKLWHKLEYFFISLEILDQPYGNILIGIEDPNNK